jgi:glutaredoxin 3
VQKVNPRACYVSLVKRVIIYTTRSCGFCMAAKHLLEQKGIAYREIHADGRPDLRSWISQASGRHTVPQVFIDGSSIGGYTRLAALAASGELDELLSAAPPAEEPAFPS